MSTVRYLIGQITERSAVNKNFLKVAFQQMKLDENLLMVRAFDSIDLVLSAHTNRNSIVICAMPFKIFNKN